MALTGSEFVELLTTPCPKTQVVVDEHLSDFGNVLLLHPLVADIRRFAIGRFDAHAEATLRRCLDAVSADLTDGDEYVENAIAVWLAPAVVRRDMRALSQSEGDRPEWILRCRAWERSELIGGWSMALRRHGSTRRR